MNTLHLSLIAAMSLAPVSAFAFEGSHAGAPNWPSETTIAVQGVGATNIGHRRETEFTAGRPVAWMGMVLPSEGANRPVQTANSLPLGAAG